MEEVEFEDDLLTLLDKLCLRIQRKKTHEDTQGICMVERYHFFVTHSEFGKDCAYARKCKDIFEQSDYNDIKDLVSKVVKAFRVIEGADFPTKE